MEKLSLKKKGIGSEAKAEHMEKGDTDLQLYNASERARQLHKLKKCRLQGNEDAVSCLWLNFKFIFWLIIYSPSSFPKHVLALLWHTYSLKVKSNFVRATVLLLI